MAVHFSYWISAVAKVGKKQKLSYSNKNKYRYICTKKKLNYTYLGHLHSVELKKTTKQNVNKLNYTYLGHLHSVEQKNKESTTGIITLFKSFLFCSANNYKKCWWGGDPTLPLPVLHLTLNNHVNDLWSFRIKIFVTRRLFIDDCDDNHSKTKYVIFTPSYSLYIYNFKLQIIIYFQKYRKLATQLFRAAARHWLTNPGHCQPKFNLSFESNYLHGRTH